MRNESLDECCLELFLGNGRLQLTEREIKCFRLSTNGLEATEDGRFVFFLDSSRPPMQLSLIEISLDFFVKHIVLSLKKCFRCFHA